MVRLPQGRPEETPDPRMVGPLRVEIERQPRGSVWKYHLWLLPVPAKESFRLRTNYSHAQADFLWTARLKASAMLREAKRQDADPGIRVVKTVIDPGERKSAWESFWSQLRGG